MGRFSKTWMSLNGFQCSFLFLYAGALAGTFALIIQLGAAYTARFVQYDRFNVRGEEGEQPFHAYAIGNLADGKSGRSALALAFDHVSAEGLDPFLVSFDDLIIYGNIITGFKLGKFFFAC